MSSRQWTAGSEQKIKDFRKSVWKFYRKNGRHTLPWRKTRDPYRILVSEIMLQQTQVKRVLVFYAEFTKRFPTIQKLAQVSLSEVLKAWQGLGYNRRAKYLHEAAKIIVARHAGSVPRKKTALTSLPGVGVYTAGAVRAFAWNKPDIFVETNIRSVFIHHFFQNAERRGTNAEKRGRKIHDAELVPFIASTLDRKHPREWYFALMDYGAHLKKTEGNASRRSAHHVKQKPFKGSDREVRGAILEALSQKSQQLQALVSRLHFPAKRVRKQLEALSREGLIALSKRRASLPV